MKKAEAIRWIKQGLAAEIRGRIAAEIPDYVNDAPDPELVEKYWKEVCHAAAERIWPEGIPIAPPPQS